ncbi:MAG: hypothetical protein GY763_10975 [Gammaproteobacteria bacterium]|nr:hypothetical protein [Gammaproteobacteria bacterium]
MQTALATGEGLSVFTSENPESNALRSFVVVPARYEIPHGISKPAPQPVLKKQAPFRIEILDKIEDNQKVQWSITITKNSFGRIRVRSDYSGKKKVGKVSTNWTSFKLDLPVKDRHILLFQPRDQKHLSRVYKKGKPTSAQGVSQGGGSESIDIEGRNPRLTYEVEGRVLDAAGKIIKRYNTILQMDNKDLIRQEYINHYRIPRSTAGDAGKLPVPTRDEIELIPTKPEGYAGNLLTESEYDLIIEDGAIALSKLILDAYDHMKKFHRKPGNEIKDLNGETLPIPDSRLWLSSGWRNPERNEWFSSALNGAHQLGAALDLMPNEIPRQKNAAIVYWVLWKAIKSLPDQHRFFAQLEALTIPVRPSSFKIDIEPKNGIPDAFDKADHLHINLVK